MERHRWITQALRPGGVQVLDGWVLTGPGGILADRIEDALSLRARARGLVGRDGLDAGQALLIRACRQIHTFRMRFPIDVVFCDDDMRVLYVRTLPPRRVSRIVPRARYCFELPAGRAGRCGVVDGTQLRFEGPA